jgi:cystinosin
MIIGLILACVKVLPWLDFLYGLSYIKLGMTVVKYIPQVYMNYLRKSTKGWNVYNVILDVIGGFFSTAQLFLDSWITGHWSGISGFAIKLGLGFVSIFFDAVFLLQHFVFYKTKVGKDSIVVEEKSTGDAKTDDPKKKSEDEKPAHFDSSKIEVTVE